MRFIEDTEKLIAGMREQAKQLEAGANALEAYLVPFKASKSMMDGWTAVGHAMMMPGWINPTKIDKKI